MRKNSLWITATIAAVFAVQIMPLFSEIVPEPSKSFSAPGEWTYDLAGARTYAKDNDRFFVIYYGRQGGGCGHCNTATAAIYNKDEFKNWAKQNRIALVVADVDNPSAYAYTQTKSLYNSDGKNWVGLPEMLLVDGRDGKTCCSLAEVGGSTVHATWGNATGYPPIGFYFLPFTPEMIIRYFQFALGNLNAEVESSGTVKYNKARIQAREVAVDEPGVEELKVNGVYDDYGLNRLVSTNYWKGNSKGSSYMVLRQWFKFDNKAPGTGYELKFPTLEDPAGLLTVCTYDSLDKAKLVTNYVTAVANASFTAYSNDLADGFRFTSGSQGSVYVLFTIRDPELNHINPITGGKTDWYEELNVEYNFTLQEVNGMEFWFEKQVWPGYEGETNKIAILRSSETGKASVKFSIVGKDDVGVTSVNPSNYNQASEGETGDYYIINADGTANTDYKVDFADGVLTNYIYVVNRRGEQDVHSRDRAFGLKLDSEVSEEGRYVEAFVAIEDADAEKKDTDGACAAGLEQLELKGFLNKDDEQDVYTLTNASSQVGSIYGFSVDFDMARDFQAGKIYVKVVRKGSGQRIESRAGRDSQTLADGRTEIGEGGYAFFLFGSDSETGGDVEVTVSRDAAANGEFPTVCYRLAWRRFDRPVVAFEDDEIVIPRDGTNKVYDLSLVANTIAPITDYVQEAFALDVEWCTTNGANAAVAGDDYEAVAPTNCTFTTDSSSVSVSVLSRDALLYPELTFMATLLDDTKDYMYKVDDSHRSVAFRFEADSVEASAPVEIDGSANEWQATGGRSLNYTNVVDWIKVTDVFPSICEYEYTTNYLKTVTNEVMDAKIEAAGQGANATTNFTAQIEEIVIDYTDTVHFDGSLETVTNSVSCSTNDYSVVAVDDVKDFAEGDWPTVAKIMAKNLKDESTVRVSDASPSAERIVQRKAYRLRGADLVVMPASKDDCLTVDVCTNRADDAVALYSYKLKDLLFDDFAAAPVLCFDAVGEGSVLWLRVLREADDSILAEYELFMREWDRPVFRVAETSVATNDTVAAFDLTLLREGNVSDEVTVKVVSSNETSVADGDYFSVPETVTFAANSAAATLQVTVTDPEWNALAWTGDRTFCLSLAEVCSDVGAFDFSETSNKTTVVLRETNGSGLDEADGFDEVRADVTTNDVAVAIAADGSLTNLVRTLNGCTAAGYVNDTNDWFRFTGIVAGETYCFKAVDYLVSNAEVTAEFYIGEATAPANLTTLAGLEAGWRYTAETNADVFVRIHRGQSDKVATVNYTLVAYKYIWPVVGFATDSIVVTNTDLKGEVPIEVFRRFNTNETVSVNFFAEGRADGWESNVFDGLSPETMDLPPSEEYTTNVSLIVRSADADVWVGDWSYNVYLSADADKVRFGDYTNVTVTVVDNRMEQKDATDPVDDTEDGAVVAPLADDGSLSVTNHLNGIDVAHYGVVGYSDTDDWMRITGVVAENTYRLSLANVVTVNDDGLDLVVEVRAGEVTNVVSFAEMEEAGVLVPCPTADDILVRIGRSTCTSEVPVSVKYELNAERIDWPSFTISAVADSVGNDTGTAALVVTRADNLTATNKVVLSLSDTNDVKVAFGELKRALVFEPGVSSITQSVDIVGAEPGFWKRGGEFSAVLTRAVDDPNVTIGDPSIVAVTVVDASGILENDYPADDTKDGAQVYEFSKDPSVATNYYAAGQSPSALGSNWLNGSDTVDWYRFDGTASNKTYRFSISGVSAVNAEGLGTSVTVYDADMTERGVTNLVDFAKWDFKATDANGFYVCVSRESCATNDVSIRYALSFRETASVYAEFVVDSIEVSEAADAVYVDVVCRIGEDEPLEQDAVVSVNPIEDEAAAYPANENEDFDPAPIVVTWSAGTVGGVKTVRVPLANYDGVWEGTETFLLELEPVSDIEIGKPDVMTVTIVDKDPPTYGTVGITGYGETTVREGGVFPVEFTRIGGDAGAVTGKFSWVVGKAKTEQAVVLFEDREGGAKTVNVDVPKNAAFALSQSATLTFALVAAKNTVGLTKGTPTKITLTVVAGNYGGKAADYSAGDLTKPTFRAGDSAWYLGAAGESLVAATPKAGASSAMSVSLTGPCTLSFDAAFFNADGCQLDVKVGSTVLTNLASSAEGVTVDIGAIGTKTVQFVFSRGKSGTSDLANVEISNIVVKRSSDANKTGTYTGLAEIGGKPGYATMTVAASGTFSCKMTCADRAWTVSGKNPWTDGATFTAKSGSVKKTVAFAIDAEAATVAVTDVDGQEPIATLVRNCWGDKPLSQAAAAALEKYLGYYTVALVPEDGYGSGYLGVTVSKNGAVKASGVLADGQSVSISSTLVVDEGGDAAVPLFVKPAAYNGGWFCGTLVFSLDGEGVPVLSSVGVSWTRFEKGGDSMFERTPAVAGGWYDKTENLYESYKAGLRAKVEDVQTGLSFSESGAKLTVDSYDGLFTVSFTRATGLFSGYVREYVDVNGRQVRKSYSYRGMLTPNAAEGSAAGRGFFLRGGNSVDVIVEGR